MIVVASSPFRTQTVINANVVVKREIRNKREEGRGNPPTHEYLIIDSSGEKEEFLEWTHFDASDGF